MCISLFCYDVNDGAMDQCFGGMSLIKYSANSLQMHVKYIYAPVLLICLFNVLSISDECFDHPSLVLMLIQLQV